MEDNKEIIQPAEGGEQTPSAALDEKNRQEAVPAAAARKKWFGRGIYGSKDVPIRLLDGLIGLLIAAIVILTVVFAVNGGFRVTFDTDGGNEIAFQKLRHGNPVEEPAAPVKPGYVFEGWYVDTEDESIPWNFALDKVSGDMTLTAHWAPAGILVKFDMDGGTWQGEREIPPLEVSFMEAYGQLPVPEKEGAVFDGWYYSGAQITADTQVTVTGEHVLTARWN